MVTPGCLVGPNLPTVLLRDSTPGFSFRQFLPPIERTRGSDVVRGFFAPVDSRLPDRNAEMML